ncbi:hypothetical protein MLD38_002883 [Melastoma candidum]|uniref:Uncharacterized protein n=1 Tax=Melastoma candidum TaxID=119954 RepID=A0ACB9S0I9_9MYRT|nr:hypothetical protein MLD38_002883 [Melastoma candidum]
MGSVVDDGDDRESPVYVAVGSDVEKDKATLIWTVRNLVGRKICLLHVHQPKHSFPSKDDVATATESKLLEFQALHKAEIQEVHELLTEYHSFLSRLEVYSDKVWVEMESIKEGIMEGISQYNIRWLVMGTDGEIHSSKNEPTVASKKAIEVCENAPPFLHIWFVSDGQLVYTKIGHDIESGEGIASTLLFPKLDAECGPSFCEKQGTLANDKKPISQISDLSYSILERTKSDRSNSNSSRELGPCGIERFSSPHSCEEANGNDSEEALRSPRTWCAECLPSTSKSSYVTKQEDRINEKGVNAMYLKIEPVIVDTKCSWRKEIEESILQCEEEKAEGEGEERDDAIKYEEKAKSLGLSCAKEVDRRKELERMLLIRRQEINRMRSQHHEIMEKLQIVREQKSTMEEQLSQSSHEVKELEEKIISAVDLLISFKEKRDRLRIEHEEAMTELRKLRKSVRHEDAGFCGQHILSFSFAEITEATNGFHPSWKIGEGRCGTVYKGLLRRTQVAIKMLPSFGSERASNFQQEVEVLSRVRHPNLVMLLGTCPESQSLVYEYMKNGSLEKRLSCENNKLPLPWNVRVLIAFDICSALVFLHSQKPPVVHGNLRPSKVLLDANYVGKISNVGMSRLITDKVNREDSAVYMDPECSTSGELTPESDVYSLGVILLQLISNSPVLNIVKDVRCALETGNFDGILDSSAGDWPSHQTMHLACLALRCCSPKSADRPDLLTEIWEPLRSVRPMVAASPRSKRLGQAPSHFVCPILQEVMKGPLIAADGFTYEAEAINEWFGSGHDTSPMTNLKLGDRNLVPNHALLFAIQEWQQLL